MQEVQLEEWLMILSGQCPPGWTVTKMGDGDAFRMGASRRRIAGSSGGLGDGEGEVPEQEDEDRLT